MPQVTYILPDGSRRDIEVPAGESVMEAAVRNNIRGIAADCGGFCSCATCHVYVAEQDLPRLAPQEPDELELLPLVAAPRLPNSRLSCQIFIDQSLAGLTVRIPDRQHGD
jgi:ferredoxin, 2Fe-2S